MPVKGDVRMAEALDPLVHLARRLRAGRAVLVVGGHLGGKPLLPVIEGMIARTGAADREREQARHLLATRPLAAATWVRQVMGKRLGHDLLAVLGEPRATDGLRRLLVLPFRAIISATWDDSALAAAPAGAPMPVYTPESGQVRRHTRRERYLFRLFGDPRREDSLVFGEAELARTLAEGGWGLLADLWPGHTFVFVGFAAEDLELAAILERGLASVRPEGAAHYACLPGLSRVEAGVLWEAHRVAALDSADALELAFALEGEIERTPPATDEIDEARDLQALRQRGEHDRVVDIVLARVEAEPRPEKRREQLMYLVDMLEKELERPDEALATLMAAHRAQPRDQDAEALLRLASASGAWNEYLDFRSEQVAFESAGRRATSWFEIGTLADLHGQRTRATNAYRQAVAHDPELRSARLALEALLRQEHDPTGLARAMEERYEHTPPEERALVAREIAELRNRLGDRRGAIRWFEELRHTTPTDVATLRALDRLYEEEGAQRAQAEVLGALAARIEDRREKATAYRRMAVIYEERLGAPDEAEQCLESVLVHDPGDVGAARALARLYTADGSWTAVVDLWKNHAEALPEAERGAVELELGQIHEERLDDPQQAVVHYRLAVPRLGDPRPALRALARASETLGLADETLAAMLELAAREEQPSLRASWRHRAAELALMSTPESGAAEELLHAALADDPTHVPALASLAELRAARGDHTKAAQLLSAAARNTRAGKLRAPILRRLALELEALGDPAGAAAQLREVIADEPDAATLARLDALFAQAGKDVERVAVLELLAREPDEPRVVNERLLTLGRLALRLGLTEQASAAFGRLLAHSPGHPEALRAQAAILVEQGQWTHAREQLTRLLGSGGLPRAIRAEAEAQLALCALRLGDRETAVAHLQHALDIDATHRPALLLKLELADGGAAAKIEARRAFLAGATVAERLKLWVEIGDLYLDELESPPEAVAAYVEAYRLAPEDRGVLRKCLHVFVEQKHWVQALDTLDRLIALEQAPSVRARYRTTAAQICEDELDRRDEAIRRLQAAVADDANAPRAAGKLAELLAEAGRHRELAELHLGVLAALGPASGDGKNPERLHRWSELVELYRDRLDKLDEAIVAAEVAVQLAPGDRARRRLLVELCEKRGGPARTRAIACVDQLLAEDPGDRDAYRALGRLCVETGQTARARAAEAALTWLEGGLPEPAGRPHGTARPFDEETWRLLVHPDLERAHSALYTMVGRVLAAARAQPLRQLGVSPRDRVDLDAPNGLGRVVRYALDGLGLAPVEVYLRPAQEAPVRLCAALTTSGVQPALLLGRPLSSGGRSVGEQIFEIARHTAHLVGGGMIRWLTPRPESLVHYALAAVALSDGEMVIDAQVASAQIVLRRALSSAELEQVTLLGQLLRARGHHGAPAVAAWLRAVIMTASRAAYALAGDLGAAVRCLEAEPESELLPRREHLLDLVRASVSDELDVVRRHLFTDETLARASA
jgi:tetratricopeptide (TPR) repeat protein